MKVAAQLMVPAAVALQLVVMSGASRQAPMPPPDATVAYVNMQRVAAESNAGKAGGAKLQAAQQEEVSELRELREALQAAAEEAGQTPAPERGPLEQKEQQQRAELARKTLQAQAEMQKLRREVLVQLRSQVRAVLDELLKGRNIQVVLNEESAVIWAAPTVDLTSAVIERLNADPSKR